MPITPLQFVDKWGRLQITELASYQAHFMDLCDLVGHPRPDDPQGRSSDDFRFETPVVRSSGNKGRADAFYRGKFILEYKAAHTDPHVQRHAA